MSSARNKGRKGEHEAAKILGGRRAPLSGGIEGTGDVLVGPLWRDWIVEVKRRKTLPHLLTAALHQAAAAKGKSVGDNRKPLVLYREDRGRWMVSAWAEDLVAWVEALAEVGNGNAIKAHIRSLRRQLDELEEAL